MHTTTLTHYYMDNFYFEGPYLMLHFPQTLKNFLRCCASCHSCKKSENRELLSFMRWIPNWICYSMSTDLLWDSIANDMHGPTNLPLKTSIFRVYMNIYFHIMMVAWLSLTLDLLHICIFCKFLSLWYSHLIFHKI